MIHRTRYSVTRPCITTTWIASALILIAATLRAQQPDPTLVRFETRLLAGVTALGSFDSYSAGIPMVFAPLCNRLEAGSGFGYGGGLMMEYLVNPALSLTVHARYASYPGDFSRVEMIGKSLNEEGEIDGYTGVKIPSRIQYEALEADVMLKWGGPIASGKRVRAGVAIGTSLSLPVEATMSQEHVLEFFDTDGTLVTSRSFEEQTGEELRRRTLADHQDMPRMRWQRYGLRTGVFLDYELGAGVYMTPGFYADFPLSNFTDYDWGALSLYQLQVDVAIGI